MAVDAQTLCVARVPLFMGLTNEQLLEVAALARPIHRKQGETIHGPGDDLSQLLVLHSGRVRIWHLDASGAERLVRVIEPGEFIGEAAFVTGTRPDHFTSALTDVELCSFDHSELQWLVDQYPAITLQMLRSMSARLETAEQFIAELTTTPVAARLARYLIDLPRTRSASGEVELRLPLAKKDVASLLGTTPETLSRQLNSLSESGHITVKGRGVTLLNERGLFEQATP